MDNNFNNVDFPAPLLPIYPTISPFPIVKDISSTASFVSFSLENKPFTDPNNFQTEITELVVNYSSKETIYQQDGEGTNIIGDSNEVDNYGAESDNSEAQ